MFPVCVSRYYRYISMAKGYLFGGLVGVGLGLNIDPLTDAANAIFRKRSNKMPTEVKLHV